MRPRIAVTAADPTPQDKPKLSFYLRALTAAGAEPIVVSPTGFFAGQISLEDIGGLLLSGGGDVHPHRYGQEPLGTDMNSVIPERDEMEFRLLKWALERDIPVLAICRGFQVLNVALGGTLVQHVDGHRQPRDRVAGGHWVRLAPGSRLWEALGRPERLYVNTHHHQAVTEPHLSPALSASAWLDADPTFVEGIESPHHRWVVGVQWHPERFHEFPPEAQLAQRALFRAFVRAAERVTARP